MRPNRSRHATIDDDATAMVRARIRRVTGTSATGSGADDDHSGPRTEPATPAAAEPRSEPNGWLPPTLRTARGGLDRAHVAVVVLVVLLGVAGAVILFGLGRPTIEPIAATVESSGTPIEPSAQPTGEPPATAAAVDPAPATSPTAAEPMIVHVAGLVAKPGVVELPAGSRVIDAVRAAGGATDEADLTPINLARVLTDGEQVVVTGEPPPGQPPAPPPEPPPNDGGDPAAGNAAGVPVNLNTATSEQLQSLPGIGPALAQRILDWRDENGRFTVIDELLEVSGIGEQRLADLDGLVTV